MLNYYDIKYHVVWVTKYRHKVLYGDLALRTWDLIRKICERHDVRILRGHVSRDHVHLFMSVPPYLSVAQLMQYVKGKLSRQLQQEYPTHAAALAGTSDFPCEMSLGIFNMYGES
jgi:putative transposase